MARYLMKLSVAMLLAVALPASGRGVEVYRGRDSAAKFYSAAELGVDPARHKTLDDAVADTGDARLLALKGLLLAQRGLAQLPAVDAAFAAAREQGKHRDHVRWMEGWARYLLGDIERARQLWDEAVAAHGGRPRWAPETLALAHWKLGDGEHAIEWLKIGQHSQIAISRRGAELPHTAFWPMQAKADLATLEEVERLRRTGRERLSASAVPVRVPQLVEGNAPSFPEDAKRGQNEGEAVVAVCVNSNGSIGRVEIAQSAGMPSFDAAALASARSWRFSAPRCGAAASVQWIFVPVKFDAQTAGGESSRRDDDGGYCVDSGSLDPGLAPDGWSLAVEQCPQTMSCDVAQRPEIKRCASRSPLQRPSLVVPAQFTDNLRPL